MKLIVAGSTGFIGTEIVRQALVCPSVTSIIALGRREFPVPLKVGSGVEETKLRSVVCSDFENYPDNVKQELAGADACIWTIAVVPSKLKTVTWDQACKISRDYAMTGLETMLQLPRAGASREPFRFIYISGAHAERDQLKKPFILGDYCIMRGETEARILAYAQQSGGLVEACVVKPGLIETRGNQSLATKAVNTIKRVVIGLPKVDVWEIAAVLLDQAVNGFEKDTLLNGDLIRLGNKEI